MRRLHETKTRTIELLNTLCIVKDLQQFWNTVLEGIDASYKDVNWTTSWARITIHNSIPSEINASVAETLPGEMLEYKSADKFELGGGSEDTQYPVESQNTLTAGSFFPDHCLAQKSPMLWTIMRKIGPEHGHINGSRYIGENITSNVLYTTLAMGAHTRKRLTIPRMPFSFRENNFPIQGLTRT